MTRGAGGSVQDHPYGCFISSGHKSDIELSLRRNVVLVVECCRGCKTKVSKLLGVSDASVT